MVAHLAGTNLLANIVQLHDHQQLHSQHDSIQAGIDRQTSTVTRHLLLLEFAAGVPSVASVFSRFKPERRRRWQAID